LAACDWDLALATSAFLDSEDVNSQGGYAPRAPAPQQAPATNTSNTAPPARPHSHAGGPAPVSSKPKQPARGGVASLRDFVSADDDDHDHDDSDDEGPQNYYAGGEKSGQMIQYPKDKKKPTNANEAVSDMFDSAKRHGAVHADEANKPGAPEYFGGTGFKLGDSRTQSQSIKPAAQPKKPSEITHVITFWRNGFTVDDGPLRAMNDPANAEFLSSVQKGLVPQEFRAGLDTSVQVAIDLVDNHEKEYAPPAKAKATSFSGSGHTLGSSTPSSATQPAAASASAAKPAASSASSFQVDETKPTTSIQIRLADGTRMVSKFNLTHTVADITRFVEAARRGGQAFDLMLTFPQRILSDLSQTILDAGLQNAVIVQKLK